MRIARCAGHQHRNIACIVSVLNFVGLLLSTTTASSGVSEILRAKENPSIRQALLDLRQPQWTQKDTSTLAKHGIQEKGIQFIDSLFGVTPGDNATSLRKVPFGTPTSSYCLWYGVACCLSLWLEDTDDMQTCDKNSTVDALDVREINFAGWNLTGSMSLGFTNFTSLQKLDLSDNPGLQGPLSCNFGVMKNIMYFDARNTSLTPQGAVSLTCSQAEDMIAPGCIPVLSDNNNCAAPWLDGFSSIASLEANHVYCFQPMFLHHILQYNTYSRIEVKLDYGFFMYQNCFCEDHEGHSKSKLLKPKPPDIQHLGASCPSSQKSTGGKGSKSGLSVTSTAGYVGYAALFLGAVGLLGIVWVKTRMAIKSESRAIKKKRVAPGLMDGGTRSSPQEISLMMTDVEGSTALWEWNESAMIRAMEYHDQLMRGLLPLFYGHEVRQCSSATQHTVTKTHGNDNLMIILRAFVANGYTPDFSEIYRCDTCSLLRQWVSPSSFQVTTEGDSFTLAFHDVIDAVAFACVLQLKLLDIPWPSDLHSHPVCKRLPDERKLSFTKPRQHDRSGRVGTIFCGIRVRTVVTTGIPDRISVHHVTRMHEYFGDITLMTDGLLSVAVGGMILLNSSAFASINGRLPELTSLIHSKWIDAGHILDKVKDWIKSCSFLGGQIASSSWEEGNAWCQWHPRGVFATKAMSRLVQHTRTTATSFVKWASRRRSTDASAFQHASECDSTATLSRASTITRRSISRIGSSIFSRSSSRAEIADGTLNNLNPMLVHMGWHAFVLSASSKSRGLRVEELVVVLPIRLTSRLLAYEAISSIEQVGPAFLDAPGAYEFMSCVSRKMNIPSSISNSEVTIAFCTPHGFRELLNYDPHEAEEALSIFRHCVSQSIAVCRGYECQEKDGTFMIAFEFPRDALEWSCTLHISLMDMPWPEACLHTRACGNEVDFQGIRLFSGLRAKVGVFMGEVKTLPHTTTGRADYFGIPVNRAARMQSVAAGGQTLVDEATMEAAVKAWRQGPRSMKASTETSCSESSFLSARPNDSNVIPPEAAPPVPPLPGEPLQQDNPDTVDLVTTSVRRPEGSEGSSTPTVGVRDIETPSITLRMASAKNGSPARVGSHANLEFLRGLKVTSKSRTYIPSVLQLQSAQNISWHQMRTNEDEIDGLVHGLSRVASDLSGLNERQRRSSIERLLKRARERSKLGLEGTSWPEKLLGIPRIEMVINIKGAGTYKFKGVKDPIKAYQVMPEYLMGRTRYFEEKRPSSICKGKGEKLLGASDQDEATIIHADIVDPTNVLEGTMQKQENGVNPVQ